MSIEYDFQISDDVQLSYVVDVDRVYDTKLDHSHAPEWTRLEYQQCSNCPLSRDEYSHCPVAIDLQDVIGDFQKLPAFKKAMVTVKTPEREYRKQVGLEEGLRALMGVIMATSACPILGELKPMAKHHLPFTSIDEFVLRSVSLYLIQQYFVAKDGGEPDWELKGLVERNQKLQLLNQAFWQRVHVASEGDSNLKALLSFFTMSSSVSFSLEAQLQKVKPWFTKEFNIDL